ncbi:MAG: XRE family transcriptional regulator [Prevotellaceae bacterium]|jgi:plasmid maintenance system antidote protein VapI|nr:XRE family transcriptional regulator [Prevotellaceae bacterium]
MKESVHIGELIKAKMQEDGRSASWLAEKLHCDRSNIYRIYRTHHIDTEQLLYISTLLSHDFFSHYSSLLSANSK